MTIYENVLKTIGQTPVIRLNALAPAHVEMFVKAESFNPMGSVKDRLAIGVIEAAERSGRIKPRANRSRGNQWEHRYRARHGVRTKGLPLGHRHGRELQP